jgi:hypothetical protein
MNILSTIREQFSPELLGQISQRIGETPEAAKTALDSSLQALLGSAAARAASPEGAAGLFNLLKEKTPQGGWPASGGSMLGNLNGDGGGVGSSLVNSLLGSKLGIVRDLIAIQSGMRRESASALLGTAGHLLMGLLGSQVAAQDLGASSFGQLLRSQIPHLQRFVSPDLSGLLGISNLLNPTVSPQPSYAAKVETSEPTQPAAAIGASRGGRILRLALIPLAILLAIMFIALRFQRPTSIGGTSDDTSIEASASAGITTNLELLRINAANFADRLRTAIATSDGTPINLQGVNFDSSGNLSSTTRNSLFSLWNMIKDNPAIKTTITAYGKTADEASSRATAIQSSLAKMGIEQNRIAVRSDVGESLPDVSFTK